VRNVSGNISQQQLVDGSLTRAFGPDVVVAAVDQLTNLVQHTSGVDVV